jgi:hypothetical protein
MVSGRSSKQRPTTLDVVAQIRQLRRMTIALSVALALALVTLVAWAWRVPQEVRARSFILVDEEGRGAGALVTKPGDGDAVRLGLTRGRPNTIEQVGIGDGTDLAGPIWLDTDRLASGLRMLGRRDDGYLELKANVRSLWSNVYFTGLVTEVDPVWTQTSWTQGEHNARVEADSSSGTIQPDHFER